MSTGYTIRKYSRFAVERPVYYMGPDFLRNGYVRETSLSGWRVEGDHSVYPGLILSLALFVPDEPKAIRVEQAVVRWARDGAFGLTILSVKPEEAERLARGVINLVRHHLGGYPASHSVQAVMR